MPLTDTAVRGLKSGPKTQKVFDERGLYIEIAPSGGKWWRLKFYSPVTRKEKRLSLGVYPDVSLKDARERRDAARKLIAKGIDPSQHRKQEKLERAYRGANTFEAVTREWLEKFSSNWADSHSKRVVAMFERDVFPQIGSYPIAEIASPLMLAAARKVETRALETAHRLLQSCGQVFRYGIATGRCSSDPTQPIRGKSGALPTLKGKHFAATTDPKRLGMILRALDDYSGTIIVSSALRLAPLLFVRPGELRRAEWAQIDWEQSEWRFEVSKTKKTGVSQHIVPLSRQAVSILRELYKLTGKGRLIFPGARGGGRPMSDNAVLVAMRAMEISKDDMTGHGFRAVARTVLDETLRFRPDVIEHQLAHAVRDANGRAYNRTSFLPDRHEMMQAWADYIDKLKAGAKVISFRQSA